MARRLGELDAPGLTTTAQALAAPSGEVVPAVRGEVIPGAMEDLKALSRASGTQPRLEGQAYPAYARAMAAAKDRSDHPPFRYLTEAQKASVDLKDYAMSCDPDRVYVTASAGPDVSPLRLRGEASFSIQSLEQVTLSVVGEPGAPVTFATQGGGLFCNGLSSITVLANRDGVAAADYLATLDATGLVPLVAGSPLTSGIQSFSIYLNAPSER